MSTSKVHFSIQSSQVLAVRLYVGGQRRRIYLARVVPVHLGTHWCLASINTAQLQITYYDTLHGKNPACLETLRKYISKKSSYCTTTKWHCSTCEDVPRQTNNSDCGVFACRLAWCLANRSSFNLSRSDMVSIRRRIALELLLHKLLP